MLQDSFKDKVVALLAKAIDSSDFDTKAISPLIEHPQMELGDYAFPTFALSRTLRKAPQQIAAEIASNIQPEGAIVKVEAVGPYVNFFVSNEEITKATINKVLKDKDDFGSGSDKNRKVVIEYPSPNTNKPLHLGHVRNMLLGQSLSKILSFNGFKVFQVNLNNDRGVHICQAMLAYKLFGDNKNPDKKSDHFVGDFYVLFQQKAKDDPKLEQEVQEMLVQWEAGDKETLALWKKMNTWALQGFKETYDSFGIKHDKIYNESDHYKAGKDIVMKALDKGLLEKDEKGNIVIDLENYSIPNKILLRADGTSIYITQDIVLAKIKQEDFKMDKSIYVVGSEQILHFRQLFKILEILKIYSGEAYHLAHGMVYLPEGKMKSREGKVVDADNLVSEMIQTATNEIKSRYTELMETEVSKRSNQIGMGALRFFILKYDPVKDFVFNPAESISFEGETGPYIQYAHARICSIVEKYGKKVQSSADFKLLKEKEEQHLVRLLAKFPAIIEEAARNYKPLVIARYLLDLSQLFNNFYHQHQILTVDEETKTARLLLILAIKQVLQNGLGLLSIEAPEKM